VYFDLCGELAAFPAAVAVAAAAADAAVPVFLILLRVCSGYFYISPSVADSPSVPAVLLDHVGQLDDELALLVLLAGLVGVLVLPTQRRLAALAVNVRHRMEAGEEHPLLRLAAGHVHHRVEQIGRPLAALERLRDELVVGGEVGAAVNT